MKRNIQVEQKGENFIVTETITNTTELDPIGFIDNFNKIVQDCSQLIAQKDTMIREAETMTPEKLLEKANIKGLEEVVRQNEEMLKALKPYFQKARLKLQIANKKLQRTKKIKEDKK